MKLFVPNWLLSFFPQFHAISDHIPLQPARLTLQQEWRGDVLRLWYLLTTDNQFILDVYLSLNEEEVTEINVSTIEGCTLIQCFGSYHTAQQPAAYGFIYNDMLIALYLRETFIIASLRYDYVSSTSVNPLIPFPLLQTLSGPVALLPVDQEQTDYIINEITSAYRYHSVYLSVTTPTKQFTYDKAYWWIRRFL